MGLDCSHDAWHGAYSAFRRWREKLAEVAGFPPLDLMEGYWNEGYRQSAEDAYKEAEGKFMNGRLIADFFIRICRSLPIKWEVLKKDALTILLLHSDCEGFISPRRCAKLADRLEELLPKLPKEPDGGHIGDWAEKTKQFIDGCRLAASRHERLMFR